MKKFIKLHLGAHKTGTTLLQSRMTLLHKAVAERTSPFPGRIYPTASVTGMPRAV